MIMPRRKQMERPKRTETGKREVVVITGASAGVGRATARYFGKRGARVVLIARGKRGLLAAQREIQEAGGEAIPIPADVADPESVERAAEIAELRFGPIDIWINNAMTSVFAPVWETKPEEFRRATEVCYLGYVYGTLAALKRMRPRDRGMIVQVGSALAYRSIPLQSAYCGAKHAIVGFTDSLRSELLHEGSQVRVTAVHLPAMNTPQFGWVLSRLAKKAQPVPPIFQPEVAAKAIWHATRHQRREWMVAGSTLKAIIGQKFIPGLLDRYLAKTGYDGQQTDEPRDEQRPSNLWSPVDQDRGAHGNFDSVATNHSPMLWVSQNRWKIATAASAAAAAAGALLLFRTTRQEPPEDFSSFASGVPAHPRSQPEITRLR